MVEFTGRVPDEFVQRCLSTADVCLSPDPHNPLNDVSTMNKVLEYMAMGRPIVSFDLREARVSAGDAAVYAPANDEPEFAKLIAQLLDDPEERARMGTFGKERVSGPLSWANSQQGLVRRLRGRYQRHGESTQPCCPTGHPDRAGKRAAPLSDDTVRLVTIGRIFRRRWRFSPSSPWWVRSSVTAPLC